MNRLHVKSLRRPTLMGVATIAAYVLVVAAMVTAFALQQDRINRGNDRYDRLFDAYQLLAGDCEDADDCDTEAPTPAEVAEDDPVTPTVGAPGSPGVNGLDGADGEDGRTPTTTELLELISRYCAANDDCRGPQGIPGLSGSNGANGADGASVVGPPGADGAPGAPGADGRSISSTQCVGDGADSFWQITYSDGSSETSTGPCKSTGILSLG